MFTLKAEVPPPPRLIEDITIFEALLLCTINRCVTDPIVVKTVSKKTVSVEKVSLTDELESILSCFLQEMTRINVKITSGISLNLLSLLSIISLFSCKCRKIQGIKHKTLKG
jgi:hypothetical protein